MEAKIEITQELKALIDVALEKEMKKEIDEAIERLEKRKNDLDTARVQ